MKRGVIKKTESRLITIWFPDSVLPLIDQGIQIEDSDRSKFIRRAVREKLARLNIPFAAK
jgi:metal-responsive CopG/Arc/MetJ family transcriptional regulator